MRTRNFSTNESFTLAALELPSRWKNVRRGYDVRQTLSTNGSFGHIAIEFNSFSGEDIDVSVLNLQRPGREFAESDVHRIQMLAATDDWGRSYRFSSHKSSYEFSGFYVRVASDAQKLVLTGAAPRVFFVEYTIGRENITRPR